MLKRVTFFSILLSCLIPALYLTNFAYAAEPGTIYVDNRLANDITNGTYSKANRSGGGLDGNAYKTIQSAIDHMAQGDTILVRGGTYNEYSIGLISNDRTRHGLPDKHNTLKGYPGEHVKIDGQYAYTGQYRPSIIRGTGSGGISYWTFEDLEITGGGHPTLLPVAGGIMLEQASNCVFRNLYIHDNYGNQYLGGATGGIILVDCRNILVEYCYFLRNGNLWGERNSANAQLAIYSDYKYDSTVDIATASHSNVIRYNLFDGGTDPNEYTSIAIMHKGFQRLTGYQHGENQNPADNLPNDATYREYGDKIHHNIILNSPWGIRIDKDYTQAYNNIIWLKKRDGIDNAMAIETSDYPVSGRRGSVYACVYNNTIYTDHQMGIMFAVVPYGYDGNVDGKPCEYAYGFAVNNIVENATIGYDWAPISFEASGLKNCAPGEPLDFKNFQASRNLFYRCTDGEDIYRIFNLTFTKDTFVQTPSADVVWKNDTNLPYKGTSGVDQYKTKGNYVLDSNYSIANGGYGKSHPYLAGVMIPSYIGASDPSNDQWVDRVLNLVNLSGPVIHPSDNEKPTVPAGLTATIISATQINLSWLNSTDNVDVTGYRIYRNGILIGNSVANHYADIEATSAKDSYQIAAYDAAGNVSDKCPAVTPGGSVNQPPTVSITSPSDNVLFIAPATINITADASDSDGNVTKVEFFNGSTKLGEDSTAPYSYNWANVPAGTYTLTAKATDNSGLTRQSAIITVKVNNANHPPVLTTIGNKTGKTGTQLSFTINASDPDAGTTLTYTATGLPTEASFNGTTRTFTWTPAPNQVGTHNNISFQVSDGSLTDSETITITINDGTAPTVPTGLTAGTVSASQISINWNASTDNIGVTGYRVYRNNELIKTVLAPTVTYTDTGLTPETTYSYTIRAIDAIGNQSANSQSVSATTASGISISSTQENFSANAGKGRIDVYATSGYAWTVTENSSWITITSGSSGNGNGVIEYTVTQNMGSRRSDTITVGGIPITVTQQAPKNKSFVGLFNPTAVTNQFILWNSQTASPVNQTFTSAGNGWIPVSGDWDGNRSVTTGLYDPQTRTFHLQNAPVTNFSYGAAGVIYIPVSGDWDGDGSDNVGIYNLANGTFYLTKTNGTGADINSNTSTIIIHFEWFEPTWLPIAGDWDGDGIDTVGLYSPEDGAFFLKNTHTGEWADIVFVYGPAGSQWLPVVGDWDGDQATGVGLYDSANKTFFLRDSVTSGAADISFTYNAAGAHWIPVSGDWDGQ